MTYRVTQSHVGRKIRNPRFGRILRKMRTARGLTMRELSRLAQLPVASLSDYERGYQVPRQESIESLAEVLDLDSAVLMWFAYSAHRTRCRRKDLLNSVDELMLRQLK